MNHVVNPILRTVGKVCVAAALACTLLGGGAVMAAEPAGAAIRPVLPSEYGEVIYQKYAERPNQIFIIGQSHRSAASGANGNNTVQAQAEIFRIGEWLIRQQKVRLLLPEGFFKRQAEPVPVLAQATAGEISFGPELDNDTLVAKLSDTSIFINADILLKKNYQVGLQQVEDERLYRAVREFMSSAQKGIPMGFESQLNYLQEIRSAAMLQNIPVAMEEGFRGMAGEKRAMFNVGMAHLDEMIRFLDTGEIQVSAPDFAPAGFQDYSSVTSLLEAGYGVTIILPRSLIDDQEAMKMVRLDSI